LRHQGRVRAVAFSPDGKRIITGCGDNTARLWELPEPAEGDVERIRLWVQVLTGMELGSDEVIRILDARAWRERQQRLAGLDGAPNL
jgi:WD40 repeat protein